MIIGRTSVFAEFNSDKNNLTKEKYYFISSVVRNFIINNSITKLPVCLNDIVKKNNWKVSTYGKLKNLNIAVYNTVMNKNLGFTVLTENGDYYIFYDETQNITSQRFTIAHEIGHIVLNHFISLSESREQEANMFAARLLMPMCILYECDIQSIEEIAELCFVSKISAKYRYQRFEMLKIRNKFYTDKNEIKIRNSFKKFIKSYKINK